MAEHGYSDKQLTAIGGLETVDKQAGLEFNGNPAEFSNLFTVPDPREEFSTKDGISDAVNKRICGLKERIFWLAAIGTLLSVVGLGIGLGVGLSSKSSKLSKPVPSTTTNSTTTLPSSSLPSATTTPNPFLQKDSSLSVTGWRTGTGFSSQLFYQGEDGGVRRSEYESTSKAWSNPISVLPATNGTPIAVGAYPYKHTANAWQTELFTVNGLALQEWNMNSSSHTPASANTIYNTGAGSKMGMYWPNIFYQDGNGVVQQYAYVNDTHFVQGSFSPSGNDVFADKNSRFVVAPMFVAGNVTGYSVFYQRNDGVLTQYLVDSNGKATAGATFSSTSSSAAFASFSVPSNTTSSSNDTNIYILFQDPTVSNDLQMYWTEDSSGWKGPNYFDALKGADNGTEIGCLTAAEGLDDTLGSVGWDMCRCYFMVEGVVREVLWDGGNWGVIGSVPI